MPKQQDNPQATKTVDLTGLRCPKCDYELTGLAQTKCPECGEKFSREILRQPEPSLVLGYTAHAICAFSVCNFIYQIALKILPESFFLLGSFNIEDFAFLGSSVSIVGGLIVGLTAMPVVAFATHQNRVLAYREGVLAFLLAGVNVALAFSSYGPWLS